MDVKPDITVSRRRHRPLGRLCRSRVCRRAAAGQCWNEVQFEAKSWRLRGCVRSVAAAADRGRQRQLMRQLLRPRHTLNQFARRFISKSHLFFFTLKNSVAKNQPVHVFFGTVLLA